MKNKFKLEVLHFVVHVVVGTFLFVVLGLSALGLGLFVDWVNHVHYNFVVHATLKALEYFVLFVDVVLYSKHLVKAVSQLFSKE